MVAAKVEGGWAASAKLQGRGGPPEARRFSAEPPGLHGPVSSPFSWGRPPPWGVSEAGRDLALPVSELRDRVWLRAARKYIRLERGPVWALRPCPSNHSQMGVPPREGSQSSFRPQSRGCSRLKRPLSPCRGPGPVRNHRRSWGAGGNGHQREPRALQLARPLLSAPPGWCT